MQLRPLNSQEASWFCDISNLWQARPWWLFQFHHNEIRPQSLGSNSSGKGWIEHQYQAQISSRSKCDYADGI